MNFCWLNVHDWTVWKDTHKVKVEYHFGSETGGIQQEKRCKKCNKVKTRIELDRI